MTGGSRLEIQIPGVDAQTIEFGKSVPLRQFECFSSVRMVVRLDDFDGSGIIVSSDQLSSLLDKLRRFGTGFPVKRKNDFPVFRAESESQDHEKCRRNQFRHNRFPFFKVSVYFY